MRAYVFGSLRNPVVPQVAAAIRALGFDVFDDWHGCGPEADDYWQRYETARGRSYPEALQGRLAEHVYEFDKSNIDASHIGVLVMPAGKSAHMELGYMRGMGRHTFVLFDAEPERWDVMYKFARGVAFSIPELLEQINSTTPLEPATETVGECNNENEGRTR